MQWFSLFGFEQQVFVPWNEFKSRFGSGWNVARPCFICHAWARTRGFWVVCTRPNPKGLVTTFYDFAKTKVGEMLGSLCYQNFIKCDIIVTHLQRGSTMNRPNSESNQRPLHPNATDWPNGLLLWCGFIFCMWSIIIGASNNIPCDTR
jgi:hypothetical protein